jgi:hypothetical protein
VVDDHSARSCTPMRTSRPDPYAISSTRIASFVVGRRGDGLDATTDCRLGRSSSIRAPTLRRSGPDQPCGSANPAVGSPRCTAVRPGRGSAVTRSLDDQPLLDAEVRRSWNDRAVALRRGAGRRSRRRWARNGRSRNGRGCVDRQRTRPRTSGRCGPNGRAIGAILQRRCAARRRRQVCCHPGRPGGCVPQRGPLVGSCGPSPLSRRVRTAHGRGSRYGHGGREALEANRRAPPRDGHRRRQQPTAMLSGPASGNQRAQRRASGLQSTVRRSYEGLGQ